MQLLQELLGLLKGQKQKGRLTEAEKTGYQIKVDSAVRGNWKDSHLNAASLDDIASAVSASPVDDQAHDKFNLSKLTTLVTDFIGVGPGGQGTSWEEIDYDVVSLQDDVLKISWRFSGVKQSDTEVVKTGMITIMPAE